MQNQNFQQPQQPVNIRLDQTTTVLCEKCGNKFFKDRIVVRKLSKFVLGLNDDVTFPIQVLVCDRCGEVNKDLLPPEFRSLFEEENTVVPVNKEDKWDFQTNKNESSLKVAYRKSDDAVSDDRQSNY